MIAPKHSDRTALWETLCLAVSGGIQSLTTKVNNFSEINGGAHVKHMDRAGMPCEATVCRISNLAGRMYLKMVYQLCGKGNNNSNELVPSVETGVPEPVSIWLYADGSRVAHDEWLSILMYQKGHFMVAAPQVRNSLNLKFIY